MHRALVQARERGRRRARSRGSAAHGTYGTQMNDERITFTYRTLESGARLREALLPPGGSLADLVHAYGAIIRGPDYDPYCHDLVDLTPVRRVAATAAALNMFADSFRAVDQLAVRTCLAIVAPSTVAFGLSRMYALLRAGAPEEIRIFRTRAEAEAWLHAAPLPGRA